MISYILFYLKVYARTLFVYNLATLRMVNKVDEMKEQ